MSSSSKSSSSTLAATPQCTLANPSEYHPSDWEEDNGAIDSWLAILAAKTPNLQGNTVDFTEQLLADLGVLGYGCNGCENLSFCPIDPVVDGSCTNWIMRQVSTYMAIMGSAMDFYQYAHIKLTSWGHPVFNDFWYTPPPQGSSFNAIPLLESVLNAGLGLIPEVGGILSGVAKTLETVLSSTPNSGSIGSPDRETSWDNLLNAVGNRLDQAAEAISDSASTIANTNAVLNDVLKGGQYFESGGKLDIMKEADWWDHNEAYFHAQIAVATMASQAVFLFRFPLEYIGWPNYCDQSVADNAAHYLGDNPDNTAWCDGSPM